MVSEVKSSQNNIVSTLANSQQAEQAEAKARKAENNETPSSPADEVSLTDTASKLRELEAKVANQPVVDTQRVESVKKAISDGTFRVNANQTAEKMAEFESLLSSKMGDK